MPTRDEWVAEAQRAYNRLGDAWYSHGMLILLGHAGLEWASSLSKFSAKRLRDQLGEARVVGLYLHGARVEWIVEDVLHVAERLGEIEPSPSSRPPVSAATIRRASA